MATNRNERLRNRYGICLNDSCSKGKSKEVQEIPVRKDFVCAECGKPLRECRRPQTWWEKHGKKVIVMEPVKGGYLANPPEKAAEIFAKV